MVFENGRVILTPKPVIVSSDDKSEISGALWTRATNPFKNGFTMELVIRSLGSVGATGASMSLFFINEDFNKFDSSNSHGPSKFEGLQVLVDSSDKEKKSSIVSFLNDGSATDRSGAFSSCSFPYQDSQVPFTLKVGYEEGLFKMTVNNKLCFETDKVTLPLSDGKWRLGITGSSPKDFKKYEQFEILKIKTYNKVIDELRKPTTDYLHDGPIVVTVEKPVPRNNDFFRERQEALRSQLDFKDSDSIMDKISGLENLNHQLLDKMETGSDDSGSRLVVQKQLSEVNKAVKMLTEKLYTYHIELSGFLQDLTASNSILKEHLQREKKSQEQLQASLDTLTKKFLDFQLSQNKHSGSNDLLMRKIDQLASVDTSDKSFSETVENVVSRLKYVLIPLFMVMVILSLFIYRLRHDIKHAKIL